MTGDIKNPQGDLHRKKAGPRPSKPVFRAVLSLGIIGDIHLHWDQVDADFFNSSGFHALLFTGDLPGRNPDKVSLVAAQLAALTIPGYLIPGNHDTASIQQLLAELAGSEFLSRLSAGGHAVRYGKFRDDLGNIVMTGYSRHTLSAGGVTVDLVCARPMSMGGGLNFQPLLKNNFGIETMHQSAEALIRLVDESENPIIFLAHNGPRGLGSAKNSIYGADFRSAGGDWGDQDLSDALDHARRIRKPVLAVVAGHMHYPTKQRASRPWLKVSDGILHINPARVPRIYSLPGRPDKAHHFLRLETDGGKVQVREGKFFTSREAEYTETAVFTTN